MINRKHPSDVGLTYWSHLKFAWGECFRLICISLVMFIHGFIPWVWDWKYSDYIDRAKKRIEPQDDFRNRK
ncbi:DUF6356 family protein [bacterium]|jgi:hypothetical protein|nr:DUF6356 family protein [bacterium]